MTGRSPARPSSVVLNGTPWSIVYLSDEEWKAHPRLGDNGGETHQADHSIFIRLEHPSGICDENTIREVLLHETLHAIFHMSGLSYGPIMRMPRAELEETCVSMLSDPLLCMLRDNDELRRYLLPNK